MIAHSFLKKYEAHFCLFFLAGAFLATRLPWLTGLPSLESDEVAYLSLSLDYLLSGEFSESLTRDSFGYFLPLAFPWLAALVRDFSGLAIERSAQIVSLSATLIGLTLVFFLVRKISRSNIYALGTSLFLMILPSTIFYSLSAFSEGLYLAGIWVTIWCYFKFFESRGQHWGWAVGGIATAVFLYYVRAGALLYLLATPFLLFAASWFSGNRIPIRRLLIFTMIYGGVVFSGVYLNALRLERLNGFFSWNPQINGNLAVGESLKDSGALDIYKLDDDGVLGIQKAIRGEIQHLQKPSSERIFAILKSFPRHLYKNTVLFLRGLGGYQFWIWILGFIGICFFLTLRNARHSPNQKFLGVFLLGVSAAHLLGYSVFMSWERYAIQALPYFVVAVAIGVLYARRRTVTLVLVAATIMALHATFEDFVPMRAKFGFLNGIGNSKHKRMRVKNLKMRASFADGGTVASSAPILSYYAKSPFILFPFAEDDRVKLMNWLLRNNVRTVECSVESGIGRRRIFSPACSYVDALSKEKNSGVALVAPKLYQLNLSNPNLQQVQRVAR